MLDLDSKTADAAAPTHPLLADRWSPRAFDPTAELDDPTLTALLEAARWAPSAGNSQPWRFLVARRGTVAFDAIFATLMPGNQPWAGRASALLLVAAATRDAEGAELPWALYDTGAAVAHLSTQAQALGLSVHQMGGFDAAAATERLDLPSGVVPVVVVALGMRQHADTLPGPYAEREVAPRSRRPLGDLLLAS